MGETGTLAFAPVSAAGVESELTSIDTCPAGQRSIAVGSPIMVLKSIPL